MVLIDDSEWEIAEVTEQFPLDNRHCVSAGYHYGGAGSKGCGCCRRIKTSKTGCACKPIKTMKSGKPCAAAPEATRLFCKNLATRLTLREATEADLPRISDLSRRVNQAGNGVRCGQGAAASLAAGRIPYSGGAGKRPVSRSGTGRRHRLKSGSGYAGAVFVSLAALWDAGWNRSCLRLCRRKRCACAGRIPVKNAWLYELMLREGGGSCEA